MEKGFLYYVRRKMDLEGRVNITVQEASSTSTLITINARYIVTKDVDLSNANGQNYHMHDNISFNTNGFASFPQPTTCSATGALEQEVLSTLGMQ